MNIIKTHIYILKIEKKNRKTETNNQMATPTLILNPNPDHSIVLYVSCLRPKPVMIKTSRDLVAFPQDYVYLHVVTMETNHTTQQCLGSERC